MTKSTKAWTAADIEELLRSHYQPPKHAFLTQIPDGTGLNKLRTCDAMAIGCWKSVGVELIGFEIKVSRSDWLSEIQEPQKAETFSKHCHRWFIVAPKGCIKLEELSASWGLIQPTAAGNLRIARPAELRPDRQPISIAMLAGMLRRAIYSNRGHQEQEAAIREAHDAGFKEGLREADEHLKTERESDRRRDSRYEQQIATFEAKSGLDIRSYDYGRIAEAVAVVRSLETLCLDRVIKRAESLLDAARAAQKLAESPAEALANP